MKRMLVLALFTASLAVSSCATKSGSNQMRMTQGQPPEYADGFKSGCDSGYVAAGHPYYSASKDVRRMMDDKFYSMGWNDGFAQCKGSYESFGRALR